MPRLRTAPDEASVFLNVPFDLSYEGLFVTLIAGLVALGRKPRCVLELTDGGVGRLARLVAIIRECRVSVHDLCRVGLPARFNMPFELGLACAVAQLAGPHDFMLFEREPYRLDRTLSDLKGRDPHIHGGTFDGMLGCVFDAFGSSDGNPDFARVSILAKRLRGFAQACKQQRRSRTVFSRTIFFDVVVQAADLAQAEGMIK